MTPDCVGYRKHDGVEELLRLAVTGGRGSFTEPHRERPVSVTGGLTPADPGTKARCPPEALEPPRLLAG